jgi:hypothetical protein
VKLETHKWIRLCGVNKKIQKNNSNLVIFFYGFQREINHILGSSLGNGLDHIENKMVLLVTLTNFEPNLMLININKLKLYKFIEFLQNSKI